MSTNISSQIWRIEIIYVAQYTGQFLMFALIPELLGPNDFGLFTLVNSSCLLLFSLTGFGLNLLVYRFIPEYTERDETAKARGLARKCLEIRILSIIPVLLILILLLLGYRIDIWIILVSLIYFSIMSTVQTVYSVAYGYGRSATYVAKDALKSWLRVLAILILFPPLGLIGAFIALVCVEFSILILGLVATRHAFTGKIDFELPLRKHWMTILPFFIIGIAPGVYSNLGVLLARSLLYSYTYVGYYSLALMVGGFLSTFLSALGLAMLPKIVRLKTSGQEEQVIKMVYHAVRYFTAFSPLFVLWVIFLIEPAIMVIAPNFIPSIALTQFLAIAAYPVGLGKIFHEVILASNKPSILLVARMVGLSLFAALSVLLAFYLGLTGLVLAYIISITVDRGYLIWKAGKTLGLILPLKAVLISTSLSACLGMVMWCLHPSGINLLLWLTAITSIYFGAIIGTRTLTLTELYHLIRGA